MYNVESIKKACALVRESMDAELYNNIDVAYECFTNYDIMQLFRKEKSTATLQAIRGTGTDASRMPEEVAKIVKGISKSTGEEVYKVLMNYFHVLLLDSKEYVYYAIHILVLLRPYETCKEFGITMTCPTTNKLATELYEAAVDKGCSLRTLLENRKTRVEVESASEETAIALSDTERLRKSCALFRESLDAGLYEDIDVVYALFANDHIMKLFEKEKSVASIKDVFKTVDYAYGMPEKLRQEVEEIVESEGADMPLVLMKYFYKQLLNNVEYTIYAIHVLALLRPAELYKDFGITNVSQPTNLLTQELYEAMVGRACTLQTVLDEYVARHKEYAERKSEIAEDTTKFYLDRLIKRAEKDGVYIDLMQTKAEQVVNLACYVDEYRGRIPSKLLSYRPNVSEVTLDVIKVTADYLYSKVALFEALEKLNEFKGFAIDYVGTDNYHGQELLEAAKERLAMCREIEK